MNREVLGVKPRFLAGDEMTFSDIRHLLRRLGLGGRETRIDDKSQLIRVGRDEYKYLEEERAVVVFIEMLSGAPNRLIHLSSIDQWIPPHKDQPITEEERQRIAKKIAKFLADQGYSVQIQ
jgi:hypothetical protein